jgi:hypothetical protein
MDKEHNELVSRSEVQEMIDAAIRRHNRNASLFLCVLVGWFFLYLLKDC